MVNASVAVEPTSAIEFSAPSAKRRSGVNADRGGRAPGCSCRTTLGVSGSSLATVSVAGLAPWQHG